MGTPVRAQYQYVLSLSCEDRFNFTGTGRNAKLCYSSGQARTLVISGWERFDESEIRNKEKRCHPFIHFKSRRAHRAVAFK
jgi:hypothetical protein